MSELRSVTRGTARFHIWRQTIDVSTKHGGAHIWFGRPVEDKDIDALCELMDLGAKTQAAKMRDALNSSTLFPKETSDGSSHQTGG